MSRLIVLVFVVSGLVGCGVNNLPTYDEQVTSAWSQVENQYQRRADLIPNLVATVKGFAAQEKELLTEVTRLRASVGQVRVDGNLIDNPEMLQRFEAGQARLGSALSRLMVVAERYPDLKSNQNFMALQSQLEGTENRISVARRDYILAMQQYNTELRTYPGKLWHGWLYPELKPRQDYYKATAEQAGQPPSVEF
jgi:LemA protein